MKIKKYIAAATLVLACLSSCGDSYFDTDYTAGLNGDQASDFASKNPNSFLNGIWSWMTQYQDLDDDFGIMAILHATDLMSEDIAVGTFHWFGFDYALDNRMHDYRRPYSTWNILYSMISRANEIIDLCPNVQTDEEKSLVGQALAVRGMSYYYLIQLFQNPTAADGSIDRDAPGVPLMYRESEGYSAEEIAALKGRNTVGVVLDAAEKDLSRAVQYLEEANYTRPNKNFIDANVANGLIARYYLLTQQWQKAADAANKARQGYSIMNEAGLKDGFMDINNGEWMWGFEETIDTYTGWGSFFSHMSNIAPYYSGTYYSTMIDARLYSQIPDDDLRKQLFNGAEGDSTQVNNASKPYANVKFGYNGTDLTEDYPYMRAAEMVLIEAEAYAHLGNDEKAAQVMKELMSVREPGWNMISVKLDYIYLQRRIELWGEGFSYFDLKRLNKGIDRNYDGTNHLTGYCLTVPARDVRWTYQLPDSEIQENSLISNDDQNP